MTGTPATAILRFFYRVTMIICIRYSTESRETDNRNYRIACFNYCQWVYRVCISSIHTIMYNTQREVSGAYKAVLNRRTDRQFLRYDPVDDDDNDDDDDGDARSRTGERYRHIVLLHRSIRSGECEKSLHHNRSSLEIPFFFFFLFPFHLSCLSSFFSSLYYMDRETPNRPAGRTSTCCEPRQRGEYIFASEYLADGSRIR